MTTPPLRGLVVRDPRWRAGALFLLGVWAVVWLLPVSGGASRSVVPFFQSYTTPWQGLVAAAPAPQTDQPELTHGWNALLVDALREGTVPLWNPRVFGGGAPLFDNGSSAVTSPARLLVAATSPRPIANDLFVGLHLAAAMALTYLLGHRLGRTAGAASLMAVAWPLGSFISAWSPLEVTTPMAVNLPLLTLAGVAVLRRPGLRPVAGLALAVAWTLWSGHLLWMLICIYVVVGALAGMRVGGVRRAPDRPLRWALTDVARLAGGSFWGVALLAVVLLPTGRTLGDGPRLTLAWAQIRERAPEWWRIRHVILPPGPHEADVTMNNALLYVGLLVGLLAVVGLIAGRGRAASLGRWLTLPTLLVAFVTPVAWFARFLPGMGVFEPYGRLFGWASFGLVVAAGAGWETAATAIRPRLSPMVSPAVTARLALVVAVLVPVVTALELTTVRSRLQPPSHPADRRHDLPDMPSLRAVRRWEQSRGGWPARVLGVASPGLGVTLGGNTPDSVRLDSLSGYDSTVPPSAVAAIEALNGVPPAPQAVQLRRAYFPAVQWHSLRPELLARLDVDLAMMSPALPTEEIQARVGPLIYDGPDAKIAEVADRPVPRGPRVVTRIDRMPDAMTALITHLNADGWTDTVRAVDVSIPDGAPEPTGDDPGVRVIDRGINSVELEVTRPGLVIVPTTMDPGWSAELNGRDAPIGTVNQGVIGVSAAETGRLVLRYRPDGLALGALISALAGASLLLVIARRGRRASPDSGTGGEVSHDPDEASGPPPNSEADDERSRGRGLEPALRGVRRARLVGRTQPVPPARGGGTADGAGGGPGLR